MPESSPQPRGLALLAALAALSSLALAPVPETRLKSRDHQSLGKLIGAYYEAKSETSGISDARDKLVSSIEKIEKKQKEPFLSMVEDLQAALYHSRKYKDSVPKGRPSTESFQSFYQEQGEVEYVVRAPRSYKGSKGPYPMLLVLPDAGEDPEEHLEAHWTDGDLLDGAVLAVCEMPEDESAWNELQGAVAIGMQVLGRVKQTYAIDSDRIFVAGRGKSVPTAMTLAAIFPHVFAGVVGRAGDIGEIAPTNFRNVHTLFAGGGANATAFEEAARAAGIDTCQVKPDATEADIWAWMQESVRNPHPLDVSISPVINEGRTAYWVEVEGFDAAEGPELRARADRDANRIEVESSGITTVRLYFNDLLVDMDQEITVVTNGVEHVLTLPRRLEVALNQAFSSGDPARAYVNSYLFDLPVSE